MSKVEPPCYMRHPKKSPDCPPADPLSVIASPLRLQRRVGGPYYLQLQRQIEALVHAGALPAGSGMPSERDLADRLGVSRATVKRSYDELRRARLLLSKGRRGGTVVQNVPQVSPMLDDLKGFTAEMHELGHAPTTRVIERVVVTDRAAASIFNHSSQARFLRTVRLRLADGNPMSREIAWYDLGLAPGLADWPGDTSVYVFLRERCGLALTWAQQTIEAVTSSPQETAAFGFSAPSPCLLLKRMSYTADGRLGEYVEGTFRGDAYRYRIKLGF